MQKFRFASLWVIPFILLQTVLAATLPGKNFHKVVWDDFYNIRPIQEFSKSEVPKDIYYVVDYDNAKRPVRIARMLQGELRRDPVTRVAVSRIDYQPGRRVVSFFSERWQPINNRMGIHSIESSLSAAGNLLSVRFYDSAHKAVENTESVAELRFETSTDQKQRIMRFFDEQAQQVVDARGWYELRCSLDAHGWITQQINYDAKGQLLDNNDGFSMVKLTYDDDGQVQTRLEYASDPSRVPQQYAQTIWSYDEHGIVQKVEYSLVKVDKEKYWDPILGFLNAARQFADGQLTKQAKAVWSL